LIEQQGEESFRELESRLLAQVLDSNDAGVIALGGGTWAIEKNRELIQQANCVSVWLDAPFDLCWSRIPPGGGERPLARNEAYAHDLYQKRASCYSLATFRIPITPDMPPSLIANEIATLISKL
jgi:shikimate kinase